MKELAAILSILILLLSSVPCCLEREGCMESPYDGVSSYNGFSETHHDKEAPCSPFYSCGRCPGFTITSDKLIAIDIVEINFKKTVIPYQEFIPKEVYFYHLKPPRIFEV
ncbi:hypothetical protein [Flagellimonas crocea]|uniref:hypothetical protein n=1 Tax=Flagellimonas crocea TaxID=3067311 RepID=UPI00297006E7|nr:hypothetical protein [Muricauda sp. DH64]